MFCWYIFKIIVVLIPIAAAILNGVIASISDHPYVVFVEVTAANKRNVTFCGGTLIRPRHVLTAAHCVTDKVKGEMRLPVTIKRVRVRVGSGHKHSGGFRYSIESIMVHRTYTNKTRYKMQGDIAVLRVVKKFQFNYFVSPMNVPKNGSILQWYEAVGLLCYVAGWGRTEAGETDFLMWTHVNLISQEKCNEFMRPHGVEVSSTYHVCTLRGNTGPCFGDSGSGLICWAGGSSYIYGIVSFGVGCARADSPVAYVRVTSYYDFIQTAITGSGVMTRAVQNLLIPVLHYKLR